MIASYYRSQI